MYCVELGWFVEALQPYKNKVKAKLGTHNCRDKLQYFSIVLLELKIGVKLGEGKYPMV